MSNLSPAPHEDSPSPDSNAIPPGSYFAELQALRSALSAELIDEEYYACHKQQLDRQRRQQGVGFSSVLVCDYLEHPLECGCATPAKNPRGREADIEGYDYTARRGAKRTVGGFVQLADEEEGDTKVQCFPSLGPSTLGPSKVEEFEIETGEPTEGGSSVFETFANTFISFVGAGILGIPNAFRSVGVVLGSAMMVAIAFICVVCMLKLLQASKKAAQSYSVKSYGDVAWVACGNAGFATIQGSLFLTQTGFCCAYLIFIMENTHSVIGQVPTPLVLALCVLVLTPLTLLRNLSSLAPFSTFANLANLSALAVVYVTDGVRISGAHDPGVELLRLGGLPFFFGVAVYCYEGIGMVIPLQNAIEDKQKFVPVLIGTMVIVSALFLSFGVCGYLAFGEETKGSITLNLSDGLVSGFVKVALCVGLLFTYPIMIFPVSEVVDQVCLNRSHSFFVWQQNGARVALIALTVVVAAAVPDFGLFIALVGSSCCAILAFIMPAFLHYKLCREEISMVSLISDWVLIVFGVVAAVVSTRQAANDIREALANN